MNKNHILLTHLIAGNITYKDLIQDINIIIDDVKQYQLIITELLNIIPNNTNEEIDSLLNCNPVDKLNTLLYLFKSADEK